MQILLAIFAIVQTIQIPSSAPATRGDRFQLIVPQGWKTQYDGGYILLVHSSGASVWVQRISGTNNLADYAQRRAERIMLPLGFAKLGEPRYFMDGKDEWVQYEIRGNRLSAARHILYRVVRRDISFYESVYEAPENQFDELLTEAQGIASSVQALIQRPVERARR